MPCLYPEVLEKLIHKIDLNADEASWLMNQTMSGILTPAQIAAWLIALRAKGETSVEISTFALVMREKAVAVTGLPEPLLDTCGTGGDKSHLVNISTLSALVLAARGIRVAKHGNRSVSSNSGSADFLEKAGYPLNASPEAVVERIKNKNFGFFFAPAFHPAMKFAGPVRKEIGVRTVFNVLGPLSNPAHATIHLMGVYSREYIAIMAQALKNLAVKTALVVHSADGLDEISPLAPTHYCLLHSDNLIYGVIEPNLFSLKINSFSDITVKDADHAYQLGVDILNGKHAVGAEMVALNAAAGEYLWDLHAGKTRDDMQVYLARKIPEILETILAGKCKPEHVIHE